MSEPISWRSRRDAWNAEYDALIALIERYETEHPDDAKCFGEAKLDIDGRMHRIVLEEQ